MKLRPEEIDVITARLTGEWSKERTIELLVAPDRIASRLTEIFVKELKVEDDLNKDVETMLAQYEKKFASGDLDRRKMFTMVKNQLAKERKIVL